MHDHEIQKEASLTLSLGIEGDGKRGASGAAEEEKISKNEMLQNKKQELAVILLQMRELHHSSTTHIVDHINYSLTQGDQAIDHALKHMSVNKLQQIRSDVGATNYEQGRLDCLSKTIFAKDIVDRTATNVAMRMSESAINAITIVKFYENYMDKYGRVSWDNFQDYIDQVMHFQHRSYSSWQLESVLLPTRNDSSCQLKLSHLPTKIAVFAIQAGNLTEYNS